jgi:hypothetical protein
VQTIQKEIFQQVEMSQEKVKNIQFLSSGMARNHQVVMKA